jgi:hypothetical protein
VARGGARTPRPAPDPSDRGTSRATGCQIGFARIFPNRKRRTWLNRTPQPIFPCTQDPWGPELDTRKWPARCRSRNGTLSKAVRNGGEPASYLGIQLSIHPRWRKEKVPRKLSQRQLRRSTRTHPHVFFMCMEVLKIQIASNRDSTFDSYLFYWWHGHLLATN